jgi:hypothetical protein
MIFDRENSKNLEKNLSQVTLSTTNPILTALIMNLSLCSDIPVTNHLSYVWHSPNRHLEEILSTNLKTQQ